MLTVIDFLGNPKRFSESQSLLANFSAAAPRGTAVDRLARLWIEYLRQRLPVGIMSGQDTLSPPGGQGLISCC